MTADKPNHILFISDWYPHLDRPFDGIFIQKLAQCIQYQPGWQVSNISFHSHNGGYLVEEQVHNGIHEVRLFYPGKAPKLLRHFRIYQLIKKAADRLVATYGPVQLVQANIMPFAALYAYRLAHQWRIPFGIREGYSVYLDDQFVDFPWFKRQLTRLVAHRADFIVAISTALGKALQRHFPKVEPVIIPNPVLRDIPEVRPAPAAPTLVSIADFRPYKGLSVLLLAFAEALQHIPDLRLDLYGKGPEENQLRKQADELGIANKVRFLGTVPNATIYERLPDYSFLAISSAVETFSNVGIEALSCGVPVLATDCGGPADFITAANGLLVAPNDAKALTDGILQMVEDDSRYDRSAIQQAALERFSMATIGQQYVSLYEEVLAR